MDRAGIKTWFVLHKWSSLISTVFLLMLCITGLPLIFHDEIEALTAEHAPLVGPASSSNSAALLSLDVMLKRALLERPGEVPLFMAFDNASPLLTVTTGPTADASASDMTLLLLDRTNGKTVAPAGGSGIMDFILELHTDMFLGLPGMLFLGGMGLLFVIAIVSGVVLYAPFMRKHDFGVLRTGRGNRVNWLDWHNLAGIVAAAWMTIVGVTGIINALATPLIDQWRNNALHSMSSEMGAVAPLPPERYGSLDRAMDRARRALPGLDPQFIGFPGGSFSSQRHYAVFFQGGTPLTQRLLIPALIDAETGKLSDVRPMPVTMKALQLSQPLHFGDYGGLPLKLLWAALTLLSILVLASGLVLWAGRRRSSLSAHLQEVTSGGRIVPEVAK